MPRTHLLGESTHAPLTPSKTNPELQRSEAGGHQHQGWVWNAWQKGYKLGVQASSDHISTHCSYRCVTAEEGTREGLLDAMRRRHCYGATTNIILDFRLRNESTEYLMGDEAPTRVIPTLVVKVVGANSIAQRRSRSSWQVKKKFVNRDAPQLDAAPPALIPAAGTARRGSSLADRRRQRAEQ
jgi:hypothetical protein